MVEKHSMESLINLLKDPNEELIFFSGNLVFNEPLFRSVYLSNTEEFGFYCPYIEDTQEKLEVSHWEARSFLLSVLDNRFNLNRGYLVYDNWNILKEEPRVINFPKFDFGNNISARFFYELANAQMETNCLKPKRKCWYSINFESITDLAGIKKAVDMILKLCYEDYKIENLYLDIERN